MSDSNGLYITYQQIEYETSQVNYYQKQRVPQAMLKGRPCPVVCHCDKHDIVDSCTNEFTVDTGIHSMQHRMR